jgi:hypothetical protein
MLEGDYVKYVARNLSLAEDPFLISTGRLSGQYSRLAKYMGNVDL